MFANDVLQQRRKRVMQDQIELERLDHVKLALEDVLLLVCVHGLIFVDTSCRNERVPPRETGLDESTASRTATRNALVV